MSCFGNGSPICCSPQRIVYQDIAIDSQGDNIHIQHLVYQELQLEQVTVHWASSVTTSELITLGKFNVTTPAFSTVLIQFDPSIGPVFDWWNVTPFRWRPGDDVYLYYANTDDIGIAAEIILRVV